MIITQQCLVSSTSCRAPRRYAGTHGSPITYRAKIAAGPRDRTYDQHRGVNQAEAARIIDTSQSRIAMLINGASSITVGDLERLAVALGFTDPGYLDSLEALRRDNHKRGFWNTGHRRAYLEELRLLVDLEAHASLLRVTEAEIVPGLIQCEPYIRALHEPRTTRRPRPPIPVRSPWRIPYARDWPARTSSPVPLRRVSTPCSRNRACAANTAAAR